MYISIKKKNSISIQILDSNFRNEYAVSGDPKTKRLINCFKEESPFHGLGLFEINKSSHIGLAATVLTYVIIMVQFQPSDSLELCNSTGSSS